VAVGLKVGGVVGTEAKAIVGTETIAGKVVVGAAAGGAGGAAAAPVQLAVSDVASGKTSPASDYVQTSLIGGATGFVLGGALSLGSALIGKVGPKPAAPEGGAGKPAGGGGKPATGPHEPTLEVREATPNERLDVLAAEKERLSVRGKELQATLKNKKSSVTVSPAIGPEGKVVDLVASAGDEIAPVHLRPNEVLVPKTKGHAEIQTQRYAASTGYQLLGTEPSRPFCANCGFWTNLAGLAYPGATVSQGSGKPALPLSKLTVEDLGRLVKPPAF
jgi:hypothetical protein